MALRPNRAFRGRAGSYRHTDYGLVILQRTIDSITSTMLSRTREFRAMARARPTGRRAKASEREVPGKAAEEALRAAKQELARMNQTPEQRVLDLTAALEAKAMRGAETE